MFARPITRLLSSSSSRIFSTLSVRTLHSTTHIVHPVEFYPYFLECVNNTGKKKSFSYYVSATLPETLKSIVNDNLRLKEVIGVNPGDLDGANLFFTKLGVSHLGKIITCVNDLVYLPPIVIHYLDQAALQKIFDTSDKLVRGIKWVSQSHHEIYEGQFPQTLKPSFWLDAMLNKLGQEHVIKLVSDSKSVAKIFSDHSITRYDSISSIVKKHLGIEEQKLPEQSVTSEQSQENNSIRPK